MLNSDGSSGSFWSKDNSLFSNPLEDILCQNEFTVEDLLEQDTVIQETKTMNEKLIKVVTNPQTLERLIGYTISSREDALELMSSPLVVKQHEDADKSGEEELQVQGDDDEEKAVEKNEAEEAAEAAKLLGEDADKDEDDNAMKLPFVACEMICCNLTPIIQVMVDSPQLLKKFFSVLDKPAPLDPRISGYFYKILSILLRRAPEKMLWFSIFQNVDISENGMESGTKGVGWLMPKFLSHIDSYSMMCCFKSFLQVAADDAGIGEDQDEDEEQLGGSYGQSDNDRNYEQMGDLDGRCQFKSTQDEDAWNSLLRVVRSIWLGGSGAALAVLDTLAASTNSDCHNNAAELLADMIQRAAMARFSLQEEDVEIENLVDESAGNHILPKFKGLVLSDKGVGAHAETAMVESGVEWTLTLCQQLLSVALFEGGNSDCAEPACSGDPTSEVSRNVENGSAAVAALQVLTHLVSAFELERWATPGDVMNVQQPLAHMTSMEKHGELPVEITVILDRLPSLAKCLTPDEQVRLLHMTPEYAQDYLGVYRLKIVELICMLVHTKYPDAIERVASCEENPLGLCIELFFKFEWNNCLHSVVERTLQFIFLGGVSEESLGFETDDGNEDAVGALFGQAESSADAENDAEKNEQQIKLRQEEISREQHAANLALLPLQNCVLKRCDIISKLLDAYKANGQAVTETEQYWSAVEGRTVSSLPQGIRKSGPLGYMGFCHRLVNTIALVSASQRNERDEHKAELSGGENTIDMFTDSYPALVATENHEEWIKLLQDEIADINLVEQCELGGTRPRTISTPLSDDLGNDMDGIDGDLIMQQARDQMMQDDSNISFNPFGTAGDDNDDDEEDERMNMYISNIRNTTQDNDDDDDDEFDMLAAESTASSEEVYVNFGESTEKTEDNKQNDQTDENEEDLSWAKFD
uniref:Uncharacterized protein n=1 Tax=Mucochytrium quahogii TaxID=96639 RepID=A0A7S2R7Q7_9STRA|mmetsp:Transcript_10858/g.23278  ORF Transcript_10858/g.23278 Transcript_10858/m.23278 type:complete len:927 (+) Transcript_10858:212-2992(+)